MGAVNEATEVLYPLDMKWTFSDADIIYLKQRPHIAGFCFTPFALNRNRLELPARLIDAPPQINLFPLRVNITPRFSVDVVTDSPLSSSGKYTYERTHYKYHNERDYRILFEHINIDGIPEDNNTPAAALTHNYGRNGVFPLIPEFNYVFIDRRTFLYFLSINNKRELYLSRSVVNFFLGEDQMRSYRTLKFSPEPLAKVIGVNFKPTAKQKFLYSLGASCPPGWKNDEVRLQGKMQLESQIGQGTSIHLSFPIT